MTRNASRSRAGSFISGMSVEIVGSGAVVREGADGAEARSEPVEVAIGAMVVSGRHADRVGELLVDVLADPAELRPGGGGSAFLAGGACGLPRAVRRGAGRLGRPGLARPGRAATGRAG